MAQPWSFEEDYIVCKFYLEHVQSWKENFEILMALLRDNDFLSRDKGSVRMRVQNYESLHTGKGLSNASKQSRDIYASMLKRITDPGKYQALHSQLDSIASVDLSSVPTDLHSYIKVGPPLGESFYKVFRRFLDASGLADPQVYGSCNMGRDTFWRIMNQKNAGINKKTVVQLCFGLRLSYEDSVLLIDAAGFSLAPGEEFDNVIATYLKNKDYDVNDVNLSLAERKVPESLFLLQKNRRSPNEEE
jgi:hypothetical protein